MVKQLQSIWAHLLILPYFSFIYVWQVFLWKKSIHISISLKDILFKILKNVIVPVIGRVFLNSSQKNMLNVNITNTFDFYKVNIHVNLLDSQFICTLLLLSQICWPAFSFCFSSNTLKFLLLWMEMWRKALYSQPTQRW